MRFTPKLIFKRILLFLTGMLVFLYIQHLTNYKFENMDNWDISLHNSLSYDDPKLITFIQNSLSPPSFLQYHLLLNEDAHNFNWGILHYHLRMLFGEHRNGFFVEAGALDGEFLSNTLWLEQEMRWTGLLVEPDKFNYQVLLQKGRKAWSSNSCLSTGNYPKQETFTAYKPMHQNESYNQNEWVLRGNNKLKDISDVDMTVSLNDALFYKSFSVVQCFPLASYLLALNVTTVDFFSLDVQGVEMDILRSFPWHKFIIKVLFVEWVSEFVNKELIEIMNEAGLVLWKIVSLEADYIFIRRDDPMFSRRHFSYLNDNLSKIKNDEKVTEVVQMNYTKSEILTIINKVEEVVNLNELESDVPLMP